MAVQMGLSEAKTKLFERIGWPLAIIIIFIIIIIIIIITEGVRREERGLTVWIVMIVRIIVHVILLYSYWGY